MGVFQARIGVSDGNGSQVEWVNALVDTGATYSYSTSTSTRCVMLLPMPW